MKVFKTTLTLLSLCKAAAFTSLPLNRPTFARSVNLSMSDGGDKLDTSKTALVLVEYQNEFTTEGGKLYEAVKDCMDQKGTLPNAKNLLDTARAMGCTVIHLPISFEQGHNEISAEPYGILANVKAGEAFAAGEWGSQICDTMKPLPGELTVKGKVGLCGFESTNLDFLMRQNGCDTMLLSGFLTNCCVESTMRAGYERGYKIYTVEDASAATSVAAHDSTFEHNFGMFSIPTSTESAISMLN